MIRAFSRYFIREIRGLGISAAANCQLLTANCFLKKNLRAFPNAKAAQANACGLRLLLALLRLLLLVFLHLALLLFLHFGPLLLLLGREHRLDL
jgi:hypothetical protein